MERKSQSKKEKSNSKKIVGIFSVFRDEKNQLKMIFDKEDGSQTVRGASKLDAMKTCRFKPGTIKAPSDNLKSSIYVSSFDDDSNSEYGSEADADSITSSIGFTSSENFASFAKKNFQWDDEKPECHYGKPITVPLLRPKNKNFHLAALASWISILKIMGDQPESEFTSGKDIESRVTPFGFIMHHLSKKYSKKDVEEATKKYQQLIGNPQVDCKDVPFLFPAHNILHQIQFLCCLGMMRSTLRDEIYCQVMKQLTHNPSQESLSRGLLLLSLIVGIFQPTEMFMPCLLEFLRQSQFDIAPKIEHSLRRALRHGTRNYPPGWSEFQAVKNYKPIFLPVIFMTGEQILVRADASTTVREVCKSVTRSIGLQQHTGFALFATHFDKISYLGTGSHRIMDTICECEYFSKASSISESNSPWNLFFRKQYFPPWETSIKDPVAANLIAAQVMRGITVEEYSLEEHQVIHFLALKFYLHHVLDNKAVLVRFIEKNMPQPYLNMRSVDVWAQNINKKIQQDLNIQRTKSSCLKEIVDFAMNQLHNSFYEFFEIKQITSLNCKLSKLSCAAQHKGLSFMDEHEESKMFLPYEDMVSLKRKGNCIYIKDIKGTIHSIESTQAVFMHSLLAQYLNELTNNSHVAVAICQCNVPEKCNLSSTLHILNSDLIILEQPFKIFLDCDYTVGKCMRTAREGQFSKDVLYPLAIIGIPDTKRLDNLSSILTATKWTQEFVGRSHHYTLDEYAKDNLQPAEVSVTKLLSRSSIRRNTGSSWTHNKEPIKHPFSKKLFMRQDLRQSSCNIFQGLLTYMGDIKQSEAISDIVLANDTIFEIVLRNKHLRNEIYVQLIKQLTENDDMVSRNKGWVLMWLITGCVAPMEDMFQEVLKFLQVSNSLLAEQCFNRIKKLQLKDNRIYSPHTMEHLAVSAYSVDAMKIEIMLSDSSIMKLEVFSDSTVLDICDEVISSRDLQQGCEYSLFLNTKDRVIPLNDNDFIMDVLSHAEIYYISQPADVKGKAYKFKFMKKLWTLEETKEDFEAKVIFDYNQDLPNYIAGFHDCSIATAVRLSALNFKATYPLTHLNNDNFKNVIIPEKFINAMTKEKWMKEIYCELNKIQNFSKRQAKLEYVNIAKSFPTYGSVFFEIQITDDPHSKQLAVNRYGISILDPVTKETFYSLSYQLLKNWIHINGNFTLIATDSNDDDKYTLSVSVPRRLNFYINSSQGELLDDLILSNVEFSLKSQCMTQHVSSGLITGETMC